MSETEQETTTADSLEITGIKLREATSLITKNRNRWSADKMREFVKEFVKNVEPNETKEINTEEAYKLFYCGSRTIKYFDYYTRVKLKETFEEQGHKAEIRANKEILQITLL